MWIDVEQNSEEWFVLRLKKVTSSNFAKIMANYGGAFGVQAKKYARKIALEIVTGVRDERSGGYKSSFMNDGHEFESTARRLYETEKFIEVTNGGFFDNGQFGDSNDGNVGQLGCIEIKCVIADTQWERIEKGGYDTSYQWQIQGHIWQGEKDWCDFVSYCPEMPKNKQLYIHRVKRDNEMIDRLKKRSAEFMIEVNKNVQLLIN